MGKPTINEVLKRQGNNLDLIRLLAALTVIFYHSLSLSPNAPISDPVKYYFHDISTGGLAVKIFFFISGLLVTNSILTRQSLIHFCISRFMRIFPGLAFVVLITAFIIGPVISSLKFTDYLTSPQLYSYIYNNLILRSDFFLPGLFEKSKYGVNGSLWTIPFEVKAYTALAITYIFMLLKNKFVATTVSLIVIFEPITPFKGFLFTSSNDSAIYLLAPCFALGSLLAINKDNLKVNILIPIALFSVQLLFSNGALKSLLVSYSVCLLTLYVSSIAPVLKLKMRHDISYGTYLWGFPIQQIYTNTLGLSWLPSLICTIITTLLIALISWLIIEKPSMVLSQRLSYRYGGLIKSTHS